MTDTTEHTHRSRHGLPLDGSVDDLSDYLIRARRQLAQVAAGTLSLADEHDPYACAYLRAVRLDLLAASSYVARSAHTLDALIARGGHGE